MYSGTIQIIKYLLQKYGIKHTVKITGLSMSEIKRICILNNISITSEDSRTLLIQELYNQYNNSEISSMLNITRQRVSQIIQQLDASEKLEILGDAKVARKKKVKSNKSVYL